MITVLRHSVLEWHKLSDIVLNSHIFLKEETEDREKRKVRKDKEERGDPLKRGSVGRVIFSSGVFMFFFAILIVHNITLFSSTHL